MQGSAKRKSEPQTLPVAASGKQRTSCSLGCYGVRYSVPAWENPEMGGKALSYREIDEWRTWTGLRDTLPVLEIIKEL
jgi:hypothetical protein